MVAALHISHAFQYKMAEHNDTRLAKESVSVLLLAKTVIDHSLGLKAEFFYV